MNKNKRPVWNSGSTYSLEHSFEWNVQNGPTFPGDVPEIPETDAKEFFGYRVGSRFGLAASLGLSADWIDLYARLGFDILTYKTVRKQARLAHPHPNWKFVKPGASLLTNAPQIAMDGLPDDPGQATAVGSLGMPSTSPDFWRKDIRRARERLLKNQVLIVSVVATSRPDMSADEFVAEFEELADRVREAGADIVEANFSCPNVSRSEGEVFRDSELSGRIAAALRRGAGKLPVLIKVGEFESDAQRTSFLQSVNGNASGVVMINGPSRVILDERGNEAFGPSRSRAGLMGGDVFEIALNSIRNAVGVVERDKLALQIVAVGGASTPQRIRKFIDAGACAALAASPAAWNPFLAIQTKLADPSV